MPLSRSARALPLLSAVLCAAGLAASLQAQPATPAAPAQPAPPAAQAAVTPTMIVLVEVNGAVMIRRPERIVADDTAGWEPGRKGAVLDQGTQIRTLLKGSALVAIGSTQQIRVDKMTTITVRQAVNDAGTERTRLDLPMGRLGISVDSTRVPNDVQITTPELTLAVRGTDFVIEHTSTHGTIARGTPTNTGSFRTAVHATGAVAKVTGSQETSSTTPDPAMAQAQAAFVPTTDPSASESDELVLAQRSTGAGESVSLSLGFSPSGQSFITSSPDATKQQLATAIFAYDQAQGRIIQTDLTGKREVVKENVVLDPQLGQAGMAVIEPAAGDRRLLLLRSGLEGTGDRVRTQNRLYQIDVSRPGTPLSFLSDFSSDQGQTLLNGLATLGLDIYASGFDILSEGRTPDSIYRLLPESGMINQTVALPGIALEGGLGGAFDRGSVFAAGRLNLFDGSDGLVLLEIDPRTNYMVAAYGGRDSDFLPAPGSSTFNATNVTSIENITGLAYIDGMVVMSATALVAGSPRSIVLQYDPAAKGTAESPRLRRVEVGLEGEFLNALASERGPHVRASVPLDLADGVVDTRSINTLFAQMSFGPEALTNDILPRLVANEIVQTAREPHACAASGALDALPAIMRRHVNRSQGVGRTVAEFRDSLPPNHPCAGH